MEHAYTLQLLDKSLERLDNAQRRGLLTSTGRTTLGRYAQELRGAIEAHRAEQTRIQGDVNLSEVGQNEALAQAFDQAQQEVTAAANRIVEYAEGEVRKAEQRAVPVPPDVPADLFEAQMANARTDARMVLDPLADTKLHTTLSELAENGTTPMRHLILGTDWPDLYLRSRDSAAAAAAWANRKLALLPLVFDEQGQAAAQALAAAPDVRAVVTIVRHVAAGWSNDAKPRSWTPTA